MCVIEEYENLMFGLFKRKKKQPGISDVIRQALTMGETGLHVNLYVDDQILFQVVHAKDYAQRGIKKGDLDGFIELHFFNKNKTLTIDNEQIAKALADKGTLTHFEEPKGIHNYIQAIGKIPDEIEKTINERIRTMYSNIDSERISIEYIEY